MSFHAATAKMAALLRSARSLKFSPLGLCQIAGTNRNGLPLNRLYSEALCGRKTGGFSRLVRPAWENASSSRVWSYAMGCVRGYTVATENKDESSLAVQSLQAQQFDWALTRLDNSVRRTGRITKTLLLRIFHDICRTGCPSANQTLLLLRSCGSLLPEVFPEERTVLAHHMWQQLEGMGVRFDVSHYNALLKVYLQNEFRFSPTDFLTKMEAANVQPNRVTYQRLIAAYCQNGDIDGASTILGFMKGKDLPITEAVFNSLVTGHARAGDIKSSEKTISVMQETGIEPGPGTYVSLLNAYAEKGDMDSVKRAMEEAENSNCSLMDKDIMQIIFTLAKTGHQQHIPDMVACLKQDRGYVPDAINLCLSLITLGQEDSAFHILKNFPTNQLSKVVTLSTNVGNFFFKHCVYMNTPMEKLIHYCKELQELNLHREPLVFTLHCALEFKKTDMSLELMKIMKEQNLPIRPHYFWPLLSQYLKDNHNSRAGVLKVLKSMQELGVTPDAETLTTYIIPVFSSPGALQQAFEEAGIPLQSDMLLCSEVCRFARHNLAQFYELLSDPSFPPFELKNFRAELIDSFRKFDDVDLMVKITKLLDTDERFSNEGSTPAEGVSYFLYNLIEKMPNHELIEQEHKMEKFFNELQAQNITIPRIYKGINTPMGSKAMSGLKNSLVDLKRSESIRSSVLQTFGVDMMAQKLAELKAENKPVGPFLKDVIQSLCAEENLQSALELKQQYKEFMTVGSYIILINHCCRHNHVEEVLKLKKELIQKNSSFVLEASKCINLVKMFTKNGKLDEAVDILKEMKEKEVVVNDMHISMFSHLFTDLAARGSIADIQRLLGTIFTTGLVKPSSTLVSHLVTAYLEVKDLHGALEAIMKYRKLYNVIPNTHKIFVALVESGDTELLQKAMDFVSRDRGEMNMIYELCFAFLQTGRYREARKMIETPGMRAKHGRLQWFAEKCISANQMETLEQMVDITSKLFGCDRNEMYNYILRLCKQTDNWQKAEAMWTKMQEENIIPSEGNLRLLAEILRTNGQEVPFEFPESWFEKAATTNQVNSPLALTECTDYKAFISALNSEKSKDKLNEAFEILKKMTENGVKLPINNYDRLIRTLLSKGAIEDAMAVIKIVKCHLPKYQMSARANNLLIITQIKKDQTKDAVETLKSMIQKVQVPSKLAVQRLVQSLGSQGDVAGIQEMETLLKDLVPTINLSSMLFINNTALAHIKNGEVDSAVEMLESYYTSQDNQVGSMSYVFRKLFEDENDQALDKLSAMAERLANHFACYRPGTDLFIHLLEMEKFEDAKHMLDRCKYLPEQKQQLISFLAEKARVPGQVGKVKAMMGMIPDLAEMAVFNTYLMKCHVMDEDLASAKLLYEHLQKQGVVLDELSLKRLAKLYCNAGEPVPFTEPPESFKFYADKLKEKHTQAMTAGE